LFTFYFTATIVLSRPDLHGWQWRRANPGGEPRYLSLSRRVALSNPTS
jgi:hypothetical protein